MQEQDVPQLHWSGLPQLPHSIDHRQEHAREPWMVRNPLFHTPPPQKKKMVIKIIIKTF